MGRQKKTTAKTYQVVLTQTAAQNIDEITAYIAFINQQPANAIKAGNAIFETIECISKHPLAFRECEGLETKTKMYRRAVFILVAFLILFQPAWAQQFHNLDFQQLCNESKTGLCYWDLSWGGKGAVQPATLDGTQYLKISGKTENAVGFTEQTAEYGNHQHLSIITASARIKAEQIVGKGAGLNIGLYNSSGQLIASKDMGGFYSLDWVQGTTGWKQYSISLVARPEASKIKTGAILFGSGDAYFKDYKVTVTPVENRKPNKLAHKYISAACDTIKKHSLVKDSIDIEALKKIALSIAGNAKKYSDCYLAINFLLESLRSFGDVHSFFMTAEEVKNWKAEGSQVSKIQYPDCKVIDSCGYITVPAFHGGNQKQILAFADSLQNGIRTLYNLNVNGWIIDLRQNTGGNMSPMVAGLGPLFSSENLGSLVDVYGNPSTWYYSRGRYFWDNDTGWSVSNALVLERKLPIAVLTSGQTGSSGEAVVVSFIGNERTKMFGQPTWGLTTGNGTFDLADGSQIYLASTIYADKNGKQYKDKIIPDFVIENDTTGKDIVLSTAIKWIHSQ